MWWFVWFLQFAERKKLRANMNSLGLNEQWLQNKPDKTDMEALLYQQILEENYPNRLSISEQVKSNNVCIW